MQQRPTFLVLDLTLTAIEQLAPLVAGIRRFDRDLANQIRNAASSIALNIGEGNRSDAGNRRARFCTAAGSNAEVRAALRVAVAWGYVRSEDAAPIDALLDRVAAMLHGLGARR
jgi:four helix bundle protein